MLVRVSIQVETFNGSIRQKMDMQTCLYMLSLVYMPRRVNFAINSQYNLPLTGIL